VRWTRRVTCTLAQALLVLLLVGCNYSGITPVKRASPQSASAIKARTHVVGRGDTLYSIAWRYGMDYRQVAEWNAIRSPYTIYPGQRLRLTKPPKTASTTTAARKSSSNSPRAPAASTGTAASAAKKPASTSRSKKRTTAAATYDNAPVKGWQWPAKGKVVTSFSRSGGKGIDIAGSFGQLVVAASAGRVVYSGSGLIGYGQLIIVKHNKRYLSAYAHNNKILVKEGDTVTGGQRIAEMGRSGSNRAMLHFEIRRDGKPIDPLRFLPK
jgi:lipoprotein NlpD